MSGGESGPFAAAESGKAFAERCTDVSTGAPVATAAAEPMRRAEYGFGNGLPTPQDLRCGCGCSRGRFTTRHRSRTVFSGRKSIFAAAESGESVRRTRYRRVHGSTRGHSGGGTDAQGGIRIWEWSADAAGPSVWLRLQPRKIHDQPSAAFRAGQTLFSFPRGRPCVSPWRWSLFPAPAFPSMGSCG